MTVPSVHEVTNKTYHVVLNLVILGKHHSYPVTYAKTIPHRSTSHHGKTDAVTVIPRRPIEITHPMQPLIERDALTPLAQSSGSKHSDR